MPQTVHVCYLRSMAGEAAARLPTFVELYEQIERLAPGLTGPDWVCEILSPSTGRDDGRSKLPLYASEDVRHVWLIEPEARLVEVFETRDGRAVQRTSGVDDDVLELPPFVDAALDLAPLWAPRKS
jgi:Uma2 family endonuclease